MSVKFTAVQWDKRKLVYDVIVVAGVALYVTLFRVLSDLTLTGPQSISSQIRDMRAWGTCAFLMLTVILLLGPLARLSPRFLPLLYNRRHLGVIFFLVAVQHAMQVLDYYHAWGPLPKLESLLSFDAAFTGSSLPFQLFGAAALVIFFLMAVTSHDFWQKFLGPAVWKSLHMLVYAGYALVVAHVVFGALQEERSVAWMALVGSSVLLVGGCHVLAARASVAGDTRIPTREVDGSTWLDAGPAEAISESRARRIPTPDGENIALVRRGGTLSAILGLCAHQGGPLYEGQVIDGCLTCPWHGWQYRPEDGRSPPPFTEKLPTFEVRLAEDGHVLVDPRPRLPAVAGGESP